MRETPDWSLPLPWRPWGVQLRVHALFPCVALGVILYVATAKQFHPEMWWHACIVLAILFSSVLLHELARIVVARRVGGRPKYVSLWPLGGLIFPDVPAAPRAHFWTALAGPVVIFGAALAAAGGLASLGFLPPPNPLASPLNPRLYNWRENRQYFSLANFGEAELHYYIDPETQQSQQVKLPFGRTEEGRRYLIQEAVEPQLLSVKAINPERTRFAVEQKGLHPLEPARLGPWPLLLSQIFAVNWLLFLVNLLPAFPLDGARVLQSWLWRHSDYRPATATAAWLGFPVMLAVGIYAIAVNDLLPAVLAAVIYFHCRAELLTLERTEEEERERKSSALGYDFSEGFTSMEREPTPAPPPPSPGWLQRWMNARAERRRLREQAEREAAEQRLDELLDKIHRQGKESLSAEERDFLTRMSSRYPNRK